MNDIKAALRFAEWRRAVGAGWWFLVFLVRAQDSCYTKTLGNLESECETALQQSDDRMYAKEYEDDYDQILCYGISFFKKRCMVKKK